MKIVHVQVIPKMSGVQQISLDIFDGLKDKNVQKFVICGENDNKNEIEQFIERFNACGVEVIIVPSMRRNIGMHDYVCFKELYKIFKKHKFDIVHTNSTKPGIIARVAARFAGIQNIVHTVHGIAFHKEAGFSKRCFYYFVENFAALFGHENITVNKYYITFYPLVKSKVIYNGVDFSKLSPVPKVKCDKIHFAFFARLDEQKNPLEFIKAVKIVHDNATLGHRARFTLAGHGELYDECKALIGKLQLEDVIAMPGWIKDKDTFLNDVDVICQPSKWEAFGLVFVEAAYFSIPSIARAVEGVPEVILDGYSGKLYTGNEKQLAQAILTFLEKPSLISEYGINAKNYSCKMFDKERMVKEYSEVYKI
ncbi:glycosyltransferase family 4 protein [Pseudescherichia sp.]|uniref:glycosyltransferase family 4 protein n=1 Tax=Pseudescherichia sp. TaxID=2055881 RepID=UPI00289D92EC|nr:glycosyltransferase family 4 protein [Pseudescherichia sp.]